LVDYVISDIMNEDVQLVVLGMGDARYVNLFSWAEQQYPGRVAARFRMDAGLAHRVYAGADMFLMPSQFEPCGLSQMIALRYGTVPVVRETGGLRDTVLSYNEYNGDGNGFTFFNYNAHDMLYTLRRAVQYYRNDRAVREKLQRRGMTGDYSWDHSAETYVQLYGKVLRAAEEWRRAVERAAMEAESARKEAEKKLKDREKAAMPVPAQEEKPAKKASPKKAPAKKKAPAAEPAEKPAKKTARKKTEKA
ncbi:MAG: glycogen synthase GlgA, partial [Clostridiales bacterium]|nr:glycogen synthase GlgA [Clostridiales bacterium]